MFSTTDMSETGVEVGDYRIRRFDELNWCIEKKHLGETGKRKGKVYYADRQYYPTLRMAAEQMLDYAIDDTDVKVLEDIIVAIEVARVKVIKAVFDLT